MDEAVLTQARGEAMFLRALAETLTRLDRSVENLLIVENGPLLRETLNNALTRLYSDSLDRAMAVAMVLRLETLMAEMAEP